MMNSQWHFWISITIAVCIASSFGICTQDDAFISFRYAQNLIEGHGLVFNPGEIVEGISNPLWTLLLALGMFLGLEPVFLSIIMGILSLIWLIWVTSQLLEEYQLPQIGLYLIALDFSLMLESVEGLESTFFAALIGQIWLLFQRFDGIDGTKYITFCFFIAFLTRPESPLLILCFILAFELSQKGMYRHISVHCFYALLNIIIAFTLLRFLYYGEFVPNTYYAKVGGAAFVRGFGYLLRFGNDHLLYACSLLAIPYFFWSHKKFRFYLIPMLCHLFYVVYIGGDFKPTGRFLITLSAFFCVLTTSMMVFVYSKKRWFFFGLLLLPMFSRVQLWSKTQMWAQTRHQNFVARRAAGLFFQNNSFPNQIIAMHSVGAVPYYAQRPCIDMWGLNDKVIARTPVQNFGTGLAGHERTNPTYVFSKEPDFYLPEDNWLQLEKYQQPITDDLPASFAQNYRAISIPLGASWLNFWIHKRNLMYGEEAQKRLQWNTYVWEKP